MTEEEAKTKWCPMVRYGELCGDDPDVTTTGNLEPVAWNRFDGDWNCKGLLCIASACMMWRWEYDKTAINPEPPTRGHCGLAGKP